MDGGLPDLRLPFANPNRRVQWEEKELVKVFAAAFLMCAVMILVAGAPLAGASTHYVVKGSQGPRASEVSWEYAPTESGVWTGHIVNSGLRSLVVDVSDVTTGAASLILHQRIRFADYNAYPSGVVNTLYVTVAASHKYNITVTPSGPRGSSCTVDDPFVIPPMPPVAIISVVSVSVDYLTIVVDGSGSYYAAGAVVSWGWDFGDGSTAMGVTATHTYGLEGTYEIVLTVLSSAGTTGSTSKLVTMVTPLIWVTFSYVVSDLSVTVDASSITSDYGIASFDWYWGDGATGTGVTAVHTYATYGDKTITLTVMDTRGVAFPMSRTVTL